MSGKSIGATPDRKASYEYDSGSSYADAKKASDARATEKKQKADKTGNTVKGAGKAVGTGLEIAGYGEYSDMAEEGGNIAGTGIKTAGSVQYAANTGDTSAALGATLDAAEAGYSTYESESAGEGAFSEKSQANNYHEQSVKQGQTEERLISKNDRDWAKAKKDHPDAFKADGTIDQSTDKGKKLAERMDTRRAKAIQADGKRYKYDTKAKEHGYTPPKDTKKA